jgi:hypothetical protein
MPNNTEQLKAKMQQIQTALMDVKGVYVHDIRHFIDGNLSVTKKGILRLPLALSAREVLPRPDDVGQVVRGEWKLVPVLMFVEPDA